MLLPPKVLGPINQLATSVTVLGAVDGATVQLLVNGAAAGVPVVATGLSTAVGLGATVLQPGQQIAATQSKGGETSVPSPFPETVSAAPSATTGLPAVVFLTGLHPCIDWVWMGGTIPGAKVVVQRAGQTVGSAGAGGANVSVPIHFPTPASAGDVLEAFQTFTPAGGAPIQGPTVPSLPLVAAPPREPPAPTVQPPLECDMAVLVSGLNEGASMIVKHNADELAGYPFVGTPVWAELVKPARGADQIAAKQKTEQCGGSSSGFSPAVGVNPAPKLPTPVILGPICPNAPLLRVRNLRPGATVTVFGETQNASGGGASAQIGQARAWATDCDFALPAGWANHPQLTSNPGALFITAFQTNCDRGSDTAKHPVAPLPGVVGTPGMTKPVECARIIAANSLTPGAVVTVRSDQADSPVLTGPIFVTASNMPIGVYRPLRAHERVQLKQTGCGVAADSASTEVDPFPGIGAPVIVGPVRIPHGGVNLKQLVVGARVYVFVNSVPTARFDATATEMFVPLPKLAREAVVFARQSMCTKISPESNRENAKLGEMKIGHSPSPITRTKQTSVTVTATDRETKQPVSGSVRIGGTVVGATGAAFAHTFASGAPPASVVDAADYVSTDIPWNLVDPAPQQAILHLGITNQQPARYTITSVTWTIARQDPGGLTIVATPTGASVAQPLSTAGQYQIHADVFVDDLVDGVNVLAEFRGNTTLPGGQHVIVWSNTDLSVPFRLFAESQVVFAGGGAITLYHAVVAP